MDLCKALHDKDALTSPVVQEYSSSHGPRASKISVLFIVMSCYHEDVPFESKCARSNIGVSEFNFVVSYVIGAGVQGHRRGVLNGGSQEVFSYRLLSRPNRSFIETPYKIST